MRADNVGVQPTVMVSGNESCGCYGTIEQFLRTDDKSLLDLLTSSHRRICHEAASAGQVAAWRNSIAVLKSAMRQLPGGFGVVFEYVLPRERGRRPDVLLLADGRIVVLEFKDQAELLVAHVDQVAAYARDLAEYQSVCRDKRVIPVLVLTRAPGMDRQSSDVWVVDRTELGHRLAILTEGDTVSVKPWAFLEGEYAPLPSLVEAARLLFQHQPLPQIRRAASAGIPETLALLHRLADDALAMDKKVLALVTGVPGSGKTLVGLQFVYDRAAPGKSNGVFLSGNGPLVEVLQHTLKSRVFVQDVHGFLKQYGGGARQKPVERVWIYDEAQRAWDNEKAREKRGPEAVSEPLDLVRLAERISGGVMILALIGEGQEIHLGEEAGIAQWNAALAATASPWQVASPDHTASIFTAGNVDIVADKRLNLDQSLRTHRASDLQAWVAKLLEGAIAKAETLSHLLRRDGFPLYATRSLGVAKAYAWDKYDGLEDKRYGLLASSKAKNLERFDIPNGFKATSAVKKGPWFGDPPSALRSCCRLDSVATEFACQGLELDLPIVAWGDDLVWDPKEQRWRSRLGRSTAKDPHRLRLNSYRVLLTRGRDGMVIFVPPTDTSMDATWEALRQAGAVELDVAAPG
jgi:hypothetical protein